MRQVAIIGQGPGCGDVPLGWEKWGLAWSKDYDIDLCFEIHKCWREIPAYSDHPVAVLNDFACDVMMLDNEDDVNNCVRYPLDEVISELGTYFESSIAYMLANAILERVPVVGLFGVSGDDGYESQRPNLEYLIGYARGVDMEVRIQEDSRLMKTAFKSGQYCLEGLH